MSLDVYYRFRDATRNSEGRPRPEVPFDFLREVRDGTRQVRAMARRIGSLQPEKIYAEFSMSARGLNYLAAAIKGVKAIDIRA
ncbi:hypothetical protein [Luteibacter sp. 329MFSha]|uniref:hypothetical protein n=1 Tax=Luteibacter sp. 329MFSha TaxID=1798239 RepID=UPI0008B90C41|nr:hypothetical protein [Luteibacter sp. 329MFSha]SEW21475.1 hypothetical protein SAMN04515660_3100 [Luteibacter sp. 329MFSha]